jgi:hypothetical protein
VGTASGPDWSVVPTTKVSAGVATGAPPGDATFGTESAMVDTWRIASAAAARVSSTRRAATRWTPASGPRCSRGAARYSGEAFGTVESRGRVGSYSSWLGRGSERGPVNALAARPLAAVHLGEQSVLAWQFAATGERRGLPMSRTRARAQPGRGQCAAGVDVPAGRRPRLAERHARERPCAAAAPVLAWPFRVRSGSEG